MIKVSPSILSADFANLGADCKRVMSAGRDMLHVDVMDGHFVPNISLGIPVVKSLRKSSDAFFDVHLMISDPLTYAPQFISAGADLVTFHLECCKDKDEVLKVIDCIKSLGKKVGISIKPATDVSEIFEYISQLDMVLIMSVEPGFGGQKFMPIRAEKISCLRKYADENGYKDLMIEVDGGINDVTAQIVKSAGADVLVAGSYIFGSEDIALAISKLKNTDKRDN